MCAGWNALLNEVSCQMVYPAKWCTLPSRTPCQMGRLAKCGTVPGEVACQMTYPIQIGQYQPHRGGGIGGLIGGGLQKQLKGTVGQLHSGEEEAAPEPPVFPPQEPEAQ